MKDFHQYQNNGPICEASAPPSGKVIPGPSGVDFKTYMLAGLSGEAINGPSGVDFSTYMIAGQASGQATTGPSGQASAGPINDIDISMYVNATNFSTFR